MQQKMDQRISILVVPITWGVAAITAIILGVCKLDWIYYLIGVCTDPDTASVMAKRQAWIGVLFRMLVFIGIFLAIFFKEVYGNPNGIWNLVIAFSGYATVKVVLIIVYLICRKRVSE